MTRFLTALLGTIAGNLAYRYVQRYLERRAAERAEAKRLDLIGQVWGVERAGRRNEEYTQALIERMTGQGQGVPGYMSKGGEA